MLADNLYDRTLSSPGNWCRFVAFATACFLTQSWLGEPVISAPPVAEADSYVANSGVGLPIWRPTRTTSGNPRPTSISGETAGPSTSIESNSSRSFDAAGTSSDVDEWSAPQHLPDTSAHLSWREPRQPSTPAPSAPKIETSVFELDRPRRTDVPHSAIVRVPARKKNLNPRGFGDVVDPVDRGSSERRISVAEASSPLDAVTSADELTPSDVETSTAEFADELMQALHVQSKIVPKSRQVRQKAIAAIAQARHESGVHDPVGVVTANLRPEKGASVRENRTSPRLTEVPIRRGTGPTSLNAPQAPAPGERLAQAIPSINPHQFRTRKELGTELAQVDAEVDELFRDNTGSTPATSAANDNATGRDRGVDESEPAVERDSSRFDGLADESTDSLPPAPDLQESPLPSIEDGSTDPADVDSSSAPSDTADESNELPPPPRLDESEKENGDVDTEDSLKSKSDRQAERDQEKVKSKQEDCEENGTSCREGFADLSKGFGRPMLVDITPSIAPRELDMTKMDAIRERELSSAPSRVWRDRQGNVLAEGNLHDYTNGRVFVRDASGETHTLKPRNMSDEDWCFLCSWWGLPPECRFGNDPAPIRNFQLTTFTWTAAATCHKPLYFEQVGVERYGHDAGPIFQPVLSGAHFFGSVVMLPYKVGLNPPNECLYTLGHYRPGDCAPWLVHGYPLSTRAIKTQGLALAAAIALLP